MLTLWLLWVNAQKNAELRWRRADFTDLMATLGMSHRGCNSPESLGQGQEVSGIGHASPSSSSIFLSFVAPRAWGGPLHAL